MPTRKVNDHQKDTDFYLKGGRQQPQSAFARQYNAFQSSSFSLQRYQLQHSQDNNRSFIERVVHQLFKDPEEEKEFLEDQNLDVVHVDLLLRQDKKIEAAELHLAENRVFEAVDLFIQDGTPSAIGRAIENSILPHWGEPISPPKTCHLCKRNRGRFQ